MSQEYHVSSLIVYATQQLEQLKAQIIALSNIEIPISEANEEGGGKLIVVIEASNQKEIANKFEQIKALPNVMALSYVFHQLDVQQTDDIFEDVLHDSN